MTKETINISFKHYCMSLLMSNGIEVTEEHKAKIAKGYIPKFIDDILVRWQKRKKSYIVLG
jgi:hypothetical protein